MATIFIRQLENRYITPLKNCSNITNLKKIHAHIIKLSLSQSNFLVTKMIDSCDNISHIGYATSLFQQLIHPNIFSYNAIIRTHAHNRHHSLAITFFIQMLARSSKSVFPDKFTFPFVIKSCAGIMCGSLGIQVHGLVFKFGVDSGNITGNALIDMYTKCGDLNLINACKVFEEMGHRDVISWNSLIFGYVRLGQMKSARELFDEMPVRTIVSWTTMVTGYARAGCYAEALGVFREMQMVGIDPDEISIIAVLPACAHLGALEVGKWIHMYADKNGFLQKSEICNALVEMYAKCGCIDEAWSLFDQLVEKDVISWSTMIGGLANHGKGYAAIQLFEEMRKVRVAPNEITFLGVLLACSHAGLWDEGLKYFDVMREDYGMEPEIEHYGCLVDLLGRSGRLGQALDTILKMSIKPDSRIWNSLLSSCRIHRNLEIAIIAMQQLMELEPEESGNYVLLANIYAELGMWENVSSIRKLIRNKRIKKTPGSSSIEVSNVVQEFVSADDSKPFSQEVFRILEELALHQTKTSDLMELVEENADTSSL
ncbi:pentatricopeptide repeat-containing protein At2g20540-like [Vicia villosa]|uniref:pentatricopeptide repeat-containing protein At2g20540-like n=1 Tax=Vicia villosa TaxID=3911 RepID=UPI00273A8978|nr:pentatricopeptide repeat-containing protein At2g20540-like [Vicia villosa]XP_058780666.1 pentatricopeptide repeat-containing protein At2g20540-like [Vicia villosa]XP_058780667.1 pentatricopeptide repeat-containing protein At2g20540-like [Vicia villosa]XP_058780668.1 pentatricopeptide repeat-containing protein At2g20540-like [Vicia villosa]